MRTLIITACVTLVALVSIPSASACAMPTNRHMDIQKALAAVDAAAKVPAVQPAPMNGLAPAVVSETPAVAPAAAPASMIPEATPAAPTPSS